VTITGSGFGATQGSGYVTLFDNGISWGAPGNAAAFQVDSWSDTAITFTVPTASGNGGVWAVTPGSTATVSVTNGTTSITAGPANLAIVGRDPATTTTTAAAVGPTPDHDDVHDHERVTGLLRHSLAGTRCALASTCCRAHER